MRAYYERVALRYLSSEGQMKEPDRHAPQPAEWLVREATPDAEASGIPSLGSVEDHR
jgi:hypothetical protein